MSGAIVVIAVHAPPPADPVGVAVETLQSFELGGGGHVETDTSLGGLKAGEPWEMGKWIDIRHPALPKTHRRHQISYVDTGKGFAIYRVNLRFEGDKNRVPADASDVAVEIARKWIDARNPIAVYITGRKGSPSEGALGSPAQLREIAWWTWVAGLPAADSGDGIVRPLAGGVVIQLSDEFHSKVALPAGVVSTLGLATPPRVHLGL
jgi:hypothetical protein